MKDGIIKLSNNLKYTPNLLEINIGCIFIN